MWSLLTHPQMQGFHYVQCQNFKPYQMMLTPSHALQVSPISLDSKFPPHSRSWSWLSFCISFRQSFLSKKNFYEKNFYFCKEFFLLDRPSPTKIHLYYKNVFVVKKYLRSLKMLSFTNKFAPQRKNSAKQFLTGSLLQSVKILCPKLVGVPL